jgi:thioredoxin-like negative regulator of GroEL
MCPNAILLLIDIDDADDIASFLKIRKVPIMLNFVDGRGCKF